MKIKLFLIFINFQIVNLINCQTLWSLEKNENGIKVFTRKIANSNFKEFKAETIINTNLNTLCAVFDDTPNSTKWLYDCIEAKKLKSITKFEGFCYYIQRLPWPLSNRDFIMKYKISQEPNTKVVTIKLENAQYYLAKTDNVRVEILNGFWQFIPLNKTEIKVIFQMHSEPNGKIPSYVANTFVVDAPYNTIKNLKKMSELEKYKKIKYKEIIEL